MKRIIVIGKSGSGKTVFSDKLSQKLSLKVIHLDKMYYKKDWTQAYSKDAFTVLVKELTNTDSWIIDGNYSRTLSLRVDRADTIVFFDTSLLLSLYYVLKRVIFPSGNRPDKHEGMKDKIGWKMLWNMTTYPTGMIMEKIYKNKSASVYVVKNHVEADELLEKLK